MFCDGLCLKQEPLDLAINVLRSVYASYAPFHGSGMKVPTPVESKVDKPRSRWSIPFILPSRAPQKDSN